MKRALLVHIENEILALKNKLKELEPFIKENASLAIVYNRTLVEKAILVEKYKNLLENQNIGKKLRKLLLTKPKEKRICDFFFNSAVVSE